VARIVLDVDDVAEYSAFLLPNPYRLIIDIHGKMPARQGADLTAPVSSSKDRNPDSEGTDVTLTQFKHETNSKPSDQAAAANIDKDEPARPTSTPTTAPTFQAIAPQESSRNRKTSSDQVARAANATAHVAAPTAAGNRSLTRTLGLKIGKIVVDAGHGGHDTGTIGPNGVMEKDVVLDVARKLGKLLETKLGAEVVYTRDDDTFIPLETRTAIANKEQADMFISIHANSSSDTTARGVETYYLNFTTSRDALEVAARENSVSEESIHELQDLVKKIALKEKIEESQEFAADVQHALVQGLNSPNFGNRGVKKAPFVVLIGANMPSILTEIAFLSNSAEEKKLKTSQYRQRIAEAIYKGISKYISGLSGVRVASQLQEDEVAKGASAVATK
jgi:N-acetylmuramoyl-L-alanine amidase